MSRSRRGKNVAELTDGSADPLVGERPVFVGGTGRSGTTVLADMVGRSAIYATIPFEVKFHTDARGFPDLFSVGDDPGELDRALALFRKRMLGRWFQRSSVTATRLSQIVFRLWPRRTRRSEDTGLIQIVSRRQLTKLVQNFVHRFPAAPKTSARVLLDGLLGTYARNRQKQWWVEMTPATMYNAALLQAIYPSARFVHIFRDGRDVACSVARRRWGPDSPAEGLEYWAEGLQRAHTATQEVPNENLLEVDFGRLVITDRLKTFKSVCDFLELPYEGAHRNFFDSRMQVNRAHVGRWRSQVPQSEQSRFNQRYTNLVNTLRNEGLTCLPE